MSRPGATVLAAAGLSCLYLSEVGPRWLAPACLLAVLSIAAARARGLVLPQAAVGTMHGLLVATFLGVWATGAHQGGAVAGLLLYAAPCTVLCLLHPPTPLDDGLVVALSLLLFLGGAGLAPGNAPLWLTVLYVAGATVALRGMARHAADRMPAAVRLVGGRRWRAAPALASAAVAAAGLFGGALLYAATPRIDRAPAEPEADLLRARRARRASLARRVPASLDLGGAPSDGTGRAVVVEVTVERGGVADEPAGGVLLRARAWDSYDRERELWTVSRTPRRPLLEGERLGPGTPEIGYHVRVAADPGDPVLLPPYAVRLLDVEADADLHGNLGWRGAPRTYGVLAAAPPRSAPVARNHPLAAIDADLAKHLRPLVDASRRASPERRIAAVRRFFRQGFSYTLEGPEHDTLQSFLLRRTGHCEHFAIAACLILRALDVPARVAGGYRCDERVGPGRYVGRLSDAHAWVEVALEDGRFLPVDVTPPSPRAARSAVPTAEEEGRGEAEAAALSPLEALAPFSYDRARQQRLFARAGEALARIRLPVLGLLLAMLLFPRAARAGGRIARRGRAPELPPEYARWVAACARRGHRRAPVQTHSEFLAAAPEDLAAEGLPLTRAFERERYGRPNV